MKILVLSSSGVGNGGFLENALLPIKNFLGDKALAISFIPFASVERDYEEYAGMVREALSGLPYTVHLVRPDSASETIERNDVVMVGGGNTFKLLHDIYANELLGLIREKIKSGSPYIGWSAGANIAGRTISTTNDMPIIQPERFEALGFFPFQINPHYINQKQENHNGETRDQRIGEFIKLNPSIPVIGLPEGTALLLQENRLQTIGEPMTVIFQGDEQGNPIRREIGPDENLSFLMQLKTFHQ
jgi:dipeptidase E